MVIYSTAYDLTVLISHIKYQRFDFAGLSRVGGLLFYLGIITSKILTYHFFLQKIILPFISVKFNYSTLYFCKIEYCHFNFLQINIMRGLKKYNCP